MSKLRSVNTGFWSDNYIIELEPTDKLLFLYLLTNEKTNMLGIYEIHIRKISFDTGINRERIAKGFEAFTKDKKASYIDGYVCMHNFTKHQSYNTNMKKSALKSFKQLPLEIRRQGFCEPLLKGLEPFPKGFEPIAKYELELERELEEEINPSLVEPDGSDVKETKIERLARLNNLSIEIAKTELRDLSTDYFKSPKDDSNVDDGLNFLTMSFFEALPDDVRNDKTVYSKKFVKWRNKIRLMHTEDDRTLKEIYKGIKAFKNDQFWNNTCQSTGNFRDNFLKIIQSQNKNETTKNKTEGKSRADTYFDTAQEVISQFKKADAN